MMLEMKRVGLLLSVVLLTCAAPLHQNNELRSSQESQVASRVISFRGTPGSDIIIKAPAGFGKPNENGQSTVTVSLRDDNTNVSFDVVSFIFSVSSEEMSNAKLGESNERASDEGMQDNGAEKHNTDNDREVSEEGPTEGFEVGHSDEELDKNEKEIPTTSDTFSSQEDSNESDSASELQKTKVHTDQSDSTEPSVLHYFPRQLIGIRSALALTLIHEETTSAEGNGKGTNPGSDISSVEGQTVPTNSESILGPFQKALSSSSEEETDDKWKNSVTDPTLSKTPRLTSSSESMVNTEVVKKNEGLPTPFFSGSDLYPEYVNDEWQYDPRYYDPYRNHPGYAGVYDPYGAGYDPYGAGYDPYGAGYDPYQAGYDPYQAGYDPYQAGYDPYGQGYDPYRAEYDPYGAGYDPYGTRHDPYQEGYDNQDPYHETENEAPRHDIEQETTPPYSVEENESHPTEISNNQDNSYSEEQPQSPSISPSSTPALLSEGSESMDSAHNMPPEEPSNSSFIETSREIGLQSSKDPNDSNSPPDPAVSNSEEGTETRHDAVGKKMTATGDSSSEESIETMESEQESQTPIDQQGNQGTPDPAIQTPSHMPAVQVNHNMQEVHNEEEPHSQSNVDLIPAFSSEEDDPLVNTIERIMSLSFNGGSSEEGTAVGTNPDSTPTDTTISENNQNKESFSDESATNTPGISAEVTHESVHLTTESPTLDSESVPTSDSLVSNEDTSSENTTSNLSANLHITTQSSEGLDNSAEANANTANDSEESQESQIFTPSTVLPIASQPSHVQHTENGSDEENTQDRESNQGISSLVSVETPAKIIATNLWMSLLQALKVPIANQSGQSIQKNVQRPQSTRHYHLRSNRRRTDDSSEESK